MFRLLRKPYGIYLSVKGDLEFYLGGGVIPRLKCLA